jgi:hypothetical protein
MKRFTFFRTPLLAALALILTMSACDFQAAEDAFDEFQVVIGLDPINTPVSGIIYDKDSGEPLTATLTFGGPGASSLIDAYSDPLDSEIVVEGGAVTFGVANSVTPSESSPFVFTVTVSAPGYYTKTRTVTATETGGLDFEVTLVPEVNATSNVQGTSSAVDNSAQADQSGTVQQTVTVQTQSNTQNNAQATATATVSQGTTAVTSSGQPLTGQIQTQIRAYDPGQGSTSLPQGATISGDGTNQAVVGGVFFLMTDANGNVAANFTSSGSGKGLSFGKSSGACSDAGGLFEVTVSITDPTTVAAVQTLGTVNAQIWGYTQADDANNQLGATELTLVGNAVEGTICVGGTLANVNLDNLGDSSQGVLFTLVLPPNLGSLATLDLAVTINNPSVATVPGTITLQGPGVYAQRSVSFPGNTKTRTLANWLGVSGNYFIVSGSTYTITVQPDGGVPAATSVSDPSAGSTTITLSPPSVTRNYNVNASFACPAGTTFDVSISESSLDGVSVFYRRLPNGNPRGIPNDENIVKTTDQSTFIQVNGQVTAIAGEQYRFTGVLDNERSSIESTAPSGTNNWNITLSSDDVGFECSAN